MPYDFLDIAITPSVRAVQASMNSDQLWVNFKGGRTSDRFTENEVAFISERDSFYIATVSETGWPYVQHRGGPRGFLKVVDDQTLAFGDFSGNRQYISTGNINTNDRACLFLMDYRRRARLKIYVHSEIVALRQEPALEKLVAVEGYRGRVERIFRLKLQAFDWNCTQHITPRFTEPEINEAVRPLRERLDLLESENAELRAQLSNIGAS